MRIKKISIFKLDIALKEPFTIAFKTYTHAHNCLVILETNEGIKGYGESSPDKPITGDSQEEASAFMKIAAERLQGHVLDIEEVHKMLSQLEEETGLKSQTGKAAIDMACYDALGKAGEKPVYEILGANAPAGISTTLTIGIKTIDDTIATARSYMARFGEHGLRRIKLKLSGKPEDDFERVLKVAEIFAGELTLDANQGYKDPEQAIKVFNRMYEEVGRRLLLVEQPTPREALNSLKIVTSKSPIPVFADESARTLDDIIRIINAGAAHGINIKLQKIGGIYYGVKAAQKAHEAGIKLMVGCNEETHIAISAAIHYASAMPGVVNVDLDSDLLLFDINIAREAPLETFVLGMRVPRMRPGLGVELADWFKSLIGEKIVLQKIA
jgi:L-alanine-DL-glutamate epimerase-like enolase superfamily enzyme